MSKFQTAWTGREFSRAYAILEKGEDYQSPEKQPEEGIQERLSEKQVNEATTEVKVSPFNLPTEPNNV